MWLFHLVCGGRSSLLECSKLCKHGKTKKLICDKSMETVF